MRSTLVRAFTRPTQAVLRPVDPTPSTKEPPNLRKPAPTGRELLDQLFGSAGISPSSSSSSSSTNVPRPSSSATDLESLFVEVQQVTEKAPLGTSAAELFEQEREHFSTMQQLPPWKLGADHIKAQKPPILKKPILPPSKYHTKKIDPFVVAGIRPQDHYLNPHFSFWFCGDPGSIHPRNFTLLTLKSQRKMAKLIKRQRAMGLVSPWSNWPAKGGYGDQRPS